MTDDVIAEVKNAMAAFETFKTDLAPKLAKMDAFDSAKFDKIQSDIAAAIQASQDEKAARTAAEKAREALEGKSAALESQVKGLEGELSAVKTALNRPGGASGEEKAKELAAKRKKLFNDFARLKDDENKRSFETYARSQITDELELKALSVNSDPNGGYLVTPEFGGVIQTKVWESSPIRQLASVITIGTDTYEVLVDNDQAGSGWVGETQARPETGTPTLGKIVIPVNELYAMPKATQKMLDDASIDVEAWLAEKVGDKFARDEATAFVSGNGVNKPKGLLAYAAGTDVSQQQVQQIGSGSSGAFTYNGLVNLQAAIKEPYQANAVFLVQRASNANLLQIVDGQGRPIFNMAYDKNVGLEPTILGKAVRFAADIPSVGVNALAAIYGDIKSAYQIVDRIGTRVLRDPYTAKPHVLFYTTKRLGAAVTNFEAYAIQKLA